MMLMYDLGGGLIGQKIADFIAVEPSCRSIQTPSTDI